MTGTIDGGAGPDRPVPPLAAAVELPGQGPIGAHFGRSREVSKPVTEADLTSHRGLFGPGTITWRIHSDPLIGLATLRSLALRVLHPQGMSGVFATARRVDDPWDRLTWTLRQLGVTTFGSGAEVAVAGARMRAVLMQVGGVDDNGQEYRGDDPDLLLWLHCCQVASFVEVTRRGGLALTDAEHETYIREQQRMAAVLGLEPNEVPGNRRELARYFRTARPRLRMTATGRAFIGAIVAPTMPDLMALTQRNRPAWAPVAGLAFGTLPSWARRLYSSPPSSGPAALSASATTIALHSLRDSLSGRAGQPGAGLT
jgi:uncharacterized protein (DUF2236 family)